ncbi:MAG TPA: homoserine dehydrogenase [Chitinispirillaceae bacterium]|nr:homoserine dehydrogenase [Chitinispirillaceae bacterium]
MSDIRIGLIGAGTVGGGVVKVLAKQIDVFKKDLGLSVKLARIADKMTSRFKDLPVGDAICTTDAQDIINDPSIDIVIELIGGTTFAKTVVLDALNHKKHVITANKALIAEYGPQIFECAEKNNVSLYFEASVGGGMPVIKAIREGLVGNDIFSVKTIINGTCNYILSTMTAEGLPFDQVLKSAQQKGYAEADPTLDISGGDSGHKVAILASLISSGYVAYDKIHREGITTIGAQDIAFANELGYVIKLLGIIKKDNNSNGLDVRVHPAMLRKNHILASVSDAFNAVLLEGDAVGQILLYGKGAGEMPTASAVVSDVIDVARNIAGKTPIRVPMNYYSSGHAVNVKNIDSITSRYYLRFTVDDEPGVLASIASDLGEQGISIASVMQKEGHKDNSVPVIILTHQASEKGISSALKKIEQSNYIRNKTQLIRIED